MRVKNGLKGNQKKQMTPDIRNKSSFYTFLIVSAQRKLNGKVSNLKGLKNKE
ncbi:hypothetical protein GCM10027347_60800 [Larkinella harenae]